MKVVPRQAVDARGREVLHGRARQHVERPVAHQGRQAPQLERPVLQLVHDVAGLGAVADPADAQLVGPGRQGLFRRQPDGLAVGLEPGGLDGCPVKGVVARVLGGGFLYRLVEAHQHAGRVVDGRDEIDARLLFVRAEKLESGRGRLAGLEAFQEALDPQRGGLAQLDGRGDDGRGLRGLAAVSRVAVCGVGQQAADLDLQGLVELPAGRHEGWRDRLAHRRAHVLADLVDAQGAVEDVVLVAIGRSSTALGADAADAHGRVAEGHHVPGGCVPGLIGARGAVEHDLAAGLLAVEVDLQPAPVDVPQQRHLPPVLRPLVRSPDVVSLAAHRQVGRLQEAVGEALDRLVSPQADEGIAARLEGLPRPRGLEVPAGVDGLRRPYVADQPLALVAAHGRGADPPRRLRVALEPRGVGDLDLPARLAHPEADRAALVVDVV